MAIVLSSWGMPGYVKETETALVYPPTFGSDLCAPKSMAFSAGVATSALDLGFNNNWVTLTASEDCYVRFGDTSTLANGSAADFPVWKGAYMNFYVGIFQFVKVFGGSNAGTIWFYRSGR